MEKVFNLRPPAMWIESVERLDVLLEVLLTKGCSQTLSLVTQLVVKTGLPRQKGSLSTFNELLKLWSYPWFVSTVSRIRNKR